MRPPRSAWIARFGPLLAVVRRRRADGSQALLGLVFGGVVLVLCVSMTGVAVARSAANASVAGSEAAAYTPPPLEALSSRVGARFVGPADRPAVVLVGDEMLAGGSGTSSMSALLARRLDARVATLEGGGSGYTALDQSGDDFATLADEIPSSTRALVFVGGANDSSASILTLVRAVSTAVGSARAHARSVAVVIVGPGWGARSAPSALQAIRDSLRSAAAGSGVAFVDPLAGSWLAGTGRTQSDLYTPTAAGREALAIQLAGVIGPRLER